MRLTIKCQDNKYRTFESIELYKAWVKEYWITVWYRTLSFT